MRAISTCTLPKILFHIPFCEAQITQERNNETTSPGPSLHSGDQECLFVCLEQRIPILLTDDMALRTAARRFNVIPVGSLGVVVAAFKGGEISLEQAEGYIADLYDVSSLFVTRAIAELAIEQLRSSAK